MMKKFITAFLFVIVLCGIASADIVYTTTDGKIGLISIQSVTSYNLEGIQYNTGLENPVIAPYWTDDKSILLAVGQNKDSSDDLAVRIESSQLTTALDSTPMTLSGVSNTKVIFGLGNGRGIYLAYGPSIREFDPDNFVPKNRLYTYTTSDENADTTIKGAGVIGNRIYVLVNDTLMRFDGQLKKDIEGFAEWSVESGAEVLAQISNSRLAIGHANGVQVLSGGLSKLFEDTGQVKEICMDNGTGFYYIMQEVSDDVYQNTLCHYDGATTNEILRFSGDYFQLMRDSGNGILAAILEDKIQLFDMTSNDQFVTEYNSSALGGSPYRMTIRTTTGEKESDSGGSCNFSSLGIISLMLILCGARKNNKA